VRATADDGAGEVPVAMATGSFTVECPAPGLPDPSAPVRPAGNGR